MLMELLSKAATVAMLSVVVSSMLAMGAGLTVSQISEPLRNVRLVVFALLANFVVMPLGALALAKVLGLDEPYGVGLLLLGCAAGAPFLPKLAELAGQCRVCCRRNGAADGCHRSLSAGRPASAAPGGYCSSLGHCSLPPT